MKKIEKYDLSVVIVSFNTVSILRDCLVALRKASDGLFVETIVVDNNSSDGSPEMVASEFPEVCLIENKENRGFAAANNQAISRAEGRYIVLLNSDAMLHPNALRIALWKMESNPEVGIAGAQLVGQDGSWQPSARSFPSPLNDFLTLTGLSARFPKSRFFGRVDRTYADPREESQVDWVPGAFSIVRYEALEQVGAFDEDFFLYYEEVDLCRRFKAAGYKVYYWPEIVVVHLGGESSRTVKHLTLSSAGSQLMLWRMRSALLYYRKNHGYLHAWSAMKIESFWHRLRLLRNRLSGRKIGHQKAQLSMEVMKLLTRAWNETGGGAESPPRPW
jgi:GT2 family glycosyltransferase